MDARILDEAADWLARLLSPDFSERDQDELRRWRNRSATHEAVWQRAQQLRLQMDSVPASVGMAVLNRPRAGAGRRHVLRTAVLALATPTLGWFTYRALPWDLWSADYRTAKGESRSVTLVDGSQVVLNTDSAIQTRFDDQVRRVLQVAGEMVVQTSHTAAFQHLPFVVQNSDGQMQALGTRFLVRKQEQSTLLSVLEGSVRVQPSRSSQTFIVQAGHQLQFDAQDMGIAVPVSPQAEGWVHGVLYAENMRLADFVAELRRYRAGVLHCDPEVADLRVSGVFQLRDTDRILALLRQSLPIRIQARTRYWVTVVPA